MVLGSLGTQTLDFSPIKGRYDGMRDLASSRESEITGICKDQTMTNHILHVVMSPFDYIIYIIDIIIDIIDIID